MIYDIKSHIKPLNLISPDVLTEDSSPIEVDLLDYGAVSILLYVGAHGGTFTTTKRIEFKLFHGSTSGSLAEATINDVEGVAAAELTAGAMTSGIIQTFAEPHATAAFYQFDYVGRERYIHLLANFHGTHGTGTSIYATVLANPLVTSNVASPKTGTN